MFVLRQLSEKRLEGHVDMAIRSMDLKKAFDTVPREMVMASVRWMGVPEAEARIVETMYEKTICSMSCSCSNQISIIVPSKLIVPCLQNKRSRIRKSPGFMTVICPVVFTHSWVSGKVLNDPVRHCGSLSFGRGYL